MSNIFMTLGERSLTFKKLIGAHILKDDANRIALLSLQKGITRTAIITEIIEQYLKNKPSLSNMVNNTVQTAVKVWRKEVNKTENSLNFFRDKLKNNLKTHRIEPEIIDVIIKKFDENVKNKKSKNNKNNKNIKNKG